MRTRSSTTIRRQADGRINPRDEDAAGEAVAKYFIALQELGAPAGVMVLAGTEAIAPMFARPTFHCVKSAFSSGEGRFA